MTLKDFLVKVFMFPSEPINAFVEQFNKLLTDADYGEFVRVLDMKGLRKVDQAVYIENFNSLQPNPTGSQQIQQASSPSAKSNIEEKESRITNIQNSTLNSCIGELEISFFDVTNRLYVDF